ncbi:signal peptidase II, partial [Photobacterium chitinilyticum]
FLNVGFGSIRTGVFNIADMVIMAGMLMFILSQNKAESAK